MADVGSIVALMITSSSKSASSGSVQPPPAGGDVNEIGGNGTFTQEHKKKQWESPIVGKKKAPNPPIKYLGLFVKLTFGCPGSQGAVVIDEMVESEGQDEEGAVAGGVHLEGNIGLVETNRLAFLGQRCLEQFSRDLRVGNKLF